MSGPAGGFGEHPSYVGLRAVLRQRHKQGTCRKREVGLQVRPTSQLALKSWPVGSADLSRPYLPAMCHPIISHTCLGLGSHHTSVLLLQACPSFRYPLSESRSNSLPPHMSLSSHAQDTSFPAWPSPGMGHTEAEKQGGTKGVGNHGFQDPRGLLTLGSVTSCVV